MSKPKLVAKKAKVNGKEITVATYVDAPAPCVQCKRNQRQNGSSRCKRCSDSYKAQLFTIARREKRREEFNSK